MRYISGLENTLSMPVKKFESCPNELESIFKYYNINDGIYICSEKLTDCFLNQSHYEHFSIAQQDTIIHFYQRYNFCEAPTSLYQCRIFKKNFCQTVYIF